MINSYNFTFFSSTLPAKHHRFVTFATATKTTATKTKIEMMTMKTMGTVPRPEPEKKETLNNPMSNQSKLVVMLFALSTHH